MNVDLVHRSGAQRDSKCSDGQSDETNDSKSATDACRETMQKVGSEIGVKSFLVIYYNKESLQ